MFDEPPLIPHELPNTLGRMKNFQGCLLEFSLSGFELAARGFELVTGRFELITCRIWLPIFEYGCLVRLNIKEGTRQRQGALMSYVCLMSHRFYDVEKLTLLGSGNLKAQRKVLF